MKKLFLVLILSIQIFQLQAQRKGYESMNDLFRRKNKLAHNLNLDLGYGHSFLQNTQFKKDQKLLGEEYFNKEGFQLGVIHAKGEIRFHKRFGIELNTGFSWNNFKSLKFSTVSVTSPLKSTYSYDFKSSIQRYTLKLNWHSLSNQRFWDIYLSPGIGFTTRKMKFSSTDPKLEKGEVWEEGIVPPSFSMNYTLNITARMWLYRHMGVYLELGSGIDNHSKKIHAYHDEIQLGICLRP